MGARKVAAFCAVVGLLLASAGAARAACISINSPGDGNGGWESSGFSSPMPPGEVAGVVPAANWNNTDQDATSGSIANLMDSAGTPTGAAASWSSTYTFDNGGTDPTGGDALMMHGYLDVGVALDISGIPYSEYDLYAYVGSATAGRIGTVDVEGTPIYFDSMGYFTGFSEAIATSQGDATRSNYAVFEGLTSPDLTVSVNNATGNVGLYGVQIVDTGEVIPEPLTMLGLLLGVGGVAGYIRRRPAT